MQQDEALDVLLAMLREGGVQLRASRLTAEDPKRAWAVFKAFCALPVAGLDSKAEQDGFLFESVLLGRGAGAQYSLSFVRRLMDAAGRGRQLTCSFSFEPTPELEELPGERLASSGLTLDDFFLQVERLPSFRVPLARGHVPSDVHVEQEHLTPRT